MIRYVGLLGGATVDLNSDKIVSTEFLKNEAGETYLSVKYDTGKRKNFPWHQIKEWGD